MRLLILYSRLSGYMTACLRELNRRHGVELLTYAYPAQANAPFDESIFSELGEVRDRTRHEVGAIEAAALAFQPDAVLVSGWFDSGYSQICRALRKKGIPVVAGCDTQWTGSWRQRLAGFIAPYHLHQFIDILWVTGERQKTLAKQLGYSGNTCWDGFYACDWELFSKIGRRRLERASADSDTSRTTTLDSERPNQSFLYVGRYAPEKGLDTLAEAYRRYRKQSDEPWDLICAGQGPCRDLLLEAGAKDLGFVSPADLPEVYAQTSAFILPSRYEPWGVVVQEAAACAVPLILSDACGAGVHLLRDRWNGRQFTEGNPESLAESMLWLSSLSSSECLSMGINSFELSRQYTPVNWARTLKDGLDLRHNS